MYEMVFPKNGRSAPKKKIGNPTSSLISSIM
jgi:hypothetical protein